MNSMKAGRIKINFFIRDMFWLRFINRNGFKYNPFTTPIYSYFKAKPCLHKVKIPKLFKCYRELKRTETKCKFV